MNEFPLILTLEEAAEFARMKPATLYKRVQEGQIRRTKNNGNVCFTRNEVLRFVGMTLKEYKDLQSIDRVMAENKELKKENEELRRRLANVQIAALGGDPVREVENIA